MSNFLNCPHCQQQLHETAPACPKCGAPNRVSTVGGYTSYDQVPWYRKSWFAVVTILLCLPLFLLIAFTGEIYFQKDGELKTVPKKAKFSVLWLFIVLVGWQLFRQS